MSEDDIQKPWLELDPNSQEYEDKVDDQYAENEDIQIVINMKISQLEKVKENEAISYYEIDKSNNLIAYVDNIKFDPKHSIKDPEEQLCAHYGINFKEVNSVELCHDSYDDV